MSSIKILSSYTTQDGVLYEQTDKGSITFKKLDTEGNASRGANRSVNFVRQAFINAMRYHDDKQLIIALELGISTLIIPPYNKMLSDYIQGKHKERGKKGESNLTNDKRKQKVWNRVHYYSGQLYPLSMPEESTKNTKNTAFSLVANELNCSPHTVRDIYKKLKSIEKKEDVYVNPDGKTEHIGTLGCCADFNKYTGMVDKMSEIVNQAISNGFSDQEAKDQAAEYFSMKPSSIDHLIH